MIGLKHFPGGGPRVAAAKGVSFSDTPELTKVQLPRWRSHVVLFILFAAFATMIVRALWLQVLSWEFLQKQGESRYARTLVLPATRGKIMDRDGAILASSIPARAIWAIPEDVLAQPKEKLAELAKLLDMSEKALFARLDSDSNFVYLKRQVEMEKASAIRKLGIKGIHSRRAFIRHYPEGEVMSHIVGFTSLEDEGQEGVELASQNLLAGMTGSRRVIRDRLGNIIEDMRAIKEPRDGSDITLSINSRIQYAAYKQLDQALKEHKAKAGGVVVLDVKTGEVLAMVNLPGFDPSKRSQLKGPRLRNRVLTDIYEPGSTLKPFIVALALEKGTVTPRTGIQTGEGRMVIGNATIGDAHQFGLLTVSQVVEKSSNVGTAKLALNMKPKEMWELFTALGFGRQPEFSFPGTTAGLVRPYKSWRPVEQATMSYGHGISVSLIQLARSYLVFARNGDMIPLSLLRVDRAPKSHQVLSPGTALAVREMLEMAAGPGGTAPRARVPGYRVAGKTGTTHKLEGGKYVDRYVSSFVGFAPVSSPQIIVAVMIDEPSAGQYFGGQVAAPVFSHVVADALRTLNVSPDSSITNIVIPKNITRESV